MDLDQKNRSLQQEIEKLQEQKNTHARLVAKASKDKRPSLILEGKEIGRKINEIKPLYCRKHKRNWKNLALLLPSIPHPLAPKGLGEQDNVEVKREGNIPDFSFTPLDHVDILEQNQWAEFAKTAEVCGSRSYSLRNEMVFLEMALHRFGLDKLVSYNFTPVQVPAFVREKALVGTGHFPTGKDQVYHLPEDDLYLSGTSEVQLNSLHAGEILDEKQLPLLYAGLSSCFRREAGSYGRDVRGLIRVHQFQKVEQYVICNNDPEESEKWHQALLNISLEIVRELELPHRVMECCTGDMGVGKVRMFDIECWVPSEKKYRETHSCSSLHDWQAKRTGLRYRDATNKIHYCHTLNNTAIATPRLMVSFLECHQQKDGSIFLPDALREYMGGAEYLMKKGEDKNGRK